MRELQTPAVSEELQSAVPLANDDTSQTDALKARILQQLEYYFGDVNLVQDTFLLNAIAADPNGWVPLETLIKFNRLRQLTADFNLIADSASRSTFLLEVSPDRHSIRRKVQLRPLHKPLNKTIYAKGFPVDCKNILDEVRRFFSPYGDVGYIKLRRDDAGRFKGSVFVDFEDEKTAEQVARLSLTYDDSPMTLMLKEEYIKMKVEEHTQKDGVEPAKRDQAAPVTQLHYLPEYDWTSSSPASTSTRFEPYPRDTGNRSHERTEDALVVFEGVGPLTLLEDIKAFFNSHDTVRYVEWSLHQPKGIVLFKFPFCASRLISKIGATAIDPGIGGALTTVRIPTQSEEDAFWDGFSRGRAHRSRDGQGGAGRGSGRGGARGNGRGNAWGNGRGNGRGGGRGSSRGHRPRGGDGSMRGGKVINGGPPKVTSATQ
ncbi:hypothetical protein BC832DRAFT_550630 [Gaertneriomyces semiglobifer]|nr:hypothetical protein BC832DRAFT_550630 [Gaertneriomyces semiglobifer]